MQAHVRSGLLMRRRVQLAAWASLLGIMACFVALVLLDRRLDVDLAPLKGLLIACIAAFFGAIAFLRMRKCPACGERFSGSLGRGVGPYTELVVVRCQHCGAALK